MDAKQDHLRRQLKRDQAEYDYTIEYEERLRVTPESYFGWYAQGGTFNESDGRMWAISSGYNEIVPVRPSIPSCAKKAVRGGDFSFTTNQRFDEVLDVCSRPRAGQAEDERWIGDKTKRILRKLRAMDVAHSIETYQGDSLDGMWLGLQICSEIVSLSVWGKDGGGYATFAALQGILCSRQASLHHAITPSFISRLFGGSMKPSDAYKPLAAQAFKKGMDFPTYPVNLPLRGFLAQTL